MNIGGHIIKPVTVNIQQQTNIHKGFIVLFLFFFFCFRKFWYYFIIDNYFKEIVIFLKISILDYISTGVFELPHPENRTLGSNSHFYSRFFMENMKLEYLSYSFISN